MSATVDYICFYLAEEEKPAVADAAVTPIAKNEVAVAPIQLGINASLYLHNCRYNRPAVLVPGYASIWYYAPFRGDDCTNGLPMVSTCFATSRSIFDCVVATMGGQALTNVAVVNTGETYGANGPTVVWNNFFKCTTYPADIRADYLCLGSAAKSQDSASKSQITAPGPSITLHQCQFQGVANPLPGFPVYKYHQWAPMECQGGLPDTSNCAASLRFIYDCGLQGVALASSYFTLNRGQSRGVPGPAAVWINPRACDVTLLKVDYLCFH